MADLSHDSYAESKRVVRKVLQQGRFVLDSDWNEQMQALVTQRRRILSALIGDVSCRFGEGFSVVGTGASLAVTIKAGFAAFLLGTKLAELLQLAEDATLSGFTSWSALRTDYVYIDIEEPEYGPAEDPSVVNPAIGEETCRDIRVKHTFRISEGGAPGAAPAGHVYISLATVTKSSGSTIGPSDVTALLDAYSVVVDTDDIVDGAITEAKIATDAVTSGKIAAGAVGQSELATGAVTLTKVGAGAVDQAALADDAVTKAKLHADVAGVGLDQAADGSLAVTGIKETGAAGAELKTRVIEIGDWNMDANASKSVAFPGDIERMKVRSLSVFVRDDTAFWIKNLDNIDIATGAQYGTAFIYTVGGVTTIELWRADAGVFNDPAYDAVSFNRGWITIWYEA